MLISLFCLYHVPNLNVTKSKNSLMFQTFDLTESKFVVDLQRLYTFDISFGLF